MTEVCTTTPEAASPELAMRQLKAYLTVNEAAGLLRRKPWPIIKAIEAGELRATMPSNDGCWLIQPADLVTYAETFGNDVPDGPLETPAVRHARDRAEVEEEVRESARLTADPEDWRGLMVREFELAGWTVEPPEGLTFFGALDLARNLRFEFESMDSAAATA